MDGLKAWDDIDDDVKLNAIGMMVLDEDGKLKMHKVGRRRGIAKGVAGGAIAVLLAGYLVTPLGLPVAPLDAANSPQKGGVQRVTPPRRAPGRSGSPSAWQAVLVGMLREASH